MPATSTTTCRDTTPEDLIPIHELLAEPARQGLILPRSKQNIQENLHKFQVAVIDNRIVGCVSLRDFGNGLFEIRSLVVADQYTGHGVGSTLIREAIRKAGQQGSVTVFALTYRPHLFERLGFNIVPKSHFPQKVWEDCRKCPNQDHCDEIAVNYNLNP